EHSNNHLRLHSAPLSVARLFSQCRQAGQAWVFTSATLSVNGDFGHFTRQLGLYEARTGRWESPFDYSRQGLLYVPQQLPLPGSAQFNSRFVDILFPLVSAAGGGVL